MGADEGPFVPLDPLAPPELGEPDPELEPDDDPPAAVPEPPDPLPPPLVPTEGALTFVPATGVEVCETETVPVGGDDTDPEPELETVAVT